MCADDEGEKPTFEKKAINIDEDMEMYSKYLERKVPKRLTVMIIMAPHYTAGKSTIRLPAALLMTLFAISIQSLWRSISVAQ